MTGARRCPTPTPTTETEADTDAGRCRGSAPKPDSPTDGRGNRGPRQPRAHCIAPNANPRWQREGRPRARRAPRSRACRARHARTHPRSQPRPPADASTDKRRSAPRPRPRLTSPGGALVLAQPVGAVATRAQIRIDAAAHRARAFRKSSGKKRDIETRSRRAHSRRRRERSASDSAARCRAKTPARTRSTRRGAGTQARSRPRRRAIRAIGVKTEPGRRTPTTPPPRAAPTRRATFAWAISLVPNQPPGASATAFRHRRRAFARAASASSTAVGVNAFPTDARTARGARGEVGARIGDRRG